MLLHLLKKAHSKTSIKNHFYARMEEWNILCTSLSELDMPANVTIPVKESGVLTGSIVKDVLQIQGWILTKVTDDVSLISTEDVENFIGPLRAEARKFCNQLTYGDIVDPEVKNIVFTVAPEYGFLANLLFGVSYTINLPVRFNPC